MGLASKCSTLLLRMTVMSRPGGVKMNEAKETGPGGNGGSEGGGQEGRVQMTNVLGDISNLVGPFLIFQNFSI